MITYINTEYGLYTSINRIFRFSWLILRDLTKFKKLLAVLKASKVECCAPDYIDESRVRVQKVEQIQRREDLPIDHSSNSSPTGAPMR